MKAFFGGMAAGDVIKRCFLQEYARAQVLMEDMPVGADQFSGEHAARNIGADAVIGKPGVMPVKTGKNRGKPYQIGQGA